MRGSGWRNIHRPCGQKIKYPEQKPSGSNVRFGMIAKQDSYEPEEIGETPITYSTERR